MECGSPVYASIVGATDGCEASSDSSDSSDESDDSQAAFMRTLEKGAKCPRRRVKVSQHASDALREWF